MRFVSNSDHSECIGLPTTYHHETAPYNLSLSLIYHNFIFSIGCRLRNFKNDERKTVLGKAPLQIRIIKQDTEVGISFLGHSL